MIGDFNGDGQDSDLHFTETWPRTTSFTTMLTVGPSPGGSTLFNVSFTGGGILDGMGYPAQISLPVTFPGSRDLLGC